MLAGCTLPSTPVGLALPFTARPTPTAVQQPLAPTVNTPPCQAAPGAYFLGDLAISAPSVLDASNADYALPSNVPTGKPLKVLVRDNLIYVRGKPIESRPAVLAPFVISLCNTSNASAHVLNGFGVMLRSLTPYTGRLLAVNGCALLYGRRKSAGGTCVPSAGTDISLSFRLVGTAKPYTTATLTLGRPIELAPGEGRVISITVPPTAYPAITTYRIGLGVDGAPILYPSALVTQPRVSAPIAQRWSGESCAVATMRAQIPATPPENTYYICPN